LSGTVVSGLLRKLFYVRLLPTLFLSKNIRLECRVAWNNLGTILTAASIAEAEMKGGMTHEECERTLAAASKIF